jgi:adenine-specific DNA-methyltransferase
MMEKMKLHSPNLTQENIARIRELFPSCVTEAQGEDGLLKLAVDFDQLRQELSESIVEGPQERYHLNWPGKREALLTANAPIAKTLRPCREESVDFVTTKNLFIEGDNLEALKLLQETYLGKVKMIYIDPPYNTGNDFIYEDDFAENADEFLKRSNQKNEEGNRLVANTESNGRFHSDWLSMIYTRLKLCRNMLALEGVIFVSINDREVHNLRKVCDEVFGAQNFVSSLVWDKNHSAQAGVFKVYHEYVLVYANNIYAIGVPTSSNSDHFEAGAMKRESARHPMTEFSFPAGVRFDAPDGTELTDTWGGIERVELIDGRMIAKNRKTTEQVTLRAAFTQKNQMQQYFYGDRDALLDSRGQKIIEFYFTSSGKIKIIKERSVETPQTTLKDYGSQGAISTELASLFGLSQTPLDNPKPPAMLKDFVRWFTQQDDLVLDYFAGSATTAHAVMQLNAEDGGTRNFIMVQLPELCDEKTEVFKAGYKTIAEISKERIRRAGKKILESECHEGWNKDIGFRVLKVDSSNMADVYYTPDAIDQTQVDAFVDNIKPDREPEDLLFQVLLDWGVDLSLPIRKETLQGKSVFFVDENALVACFDTGVNEDLVKQLAGFEPLRVVFCDNGFVSDAVKINVEQIFKQMSPGTEVKSI